MKWFIINVNKFGGRLKVMKNIICALLVLVISINVFTLEISKRQIVRAGNKGLISNTEINTSDMKKNPIQEARKDAKTSISPVIWSLISCFSSCLLPVLINYIIVFDSLALPEHTTLTSIVCCLSTTIWAYITVPEVPQDKIKNKSPNYKRAYSDTYKKVLRKNNALAVCITGGTGILSAIIFISWLVISMFRDL